MSMKRKLISVTGWLLMLGWLCPSFTWCLASEDESSLADVSTVATHVETDDADDDANDTNTYRETETRSPVRRDPFAASGRLTVQESPDRFRPGMTRGDVPRMSLRGHLKAKGGATIALLEVHGGGVHIVREGDTVGLYDLGYDSVIRIRKIDKLHLVVESGSLGRTIIVR